jgi:hypothetical protein
MTYGLRIMRKRVGEKAGPAEAALHFGFTYMREEQYGMREQRMMKSRLFKDGKGEWRESGEQSAEEFAGRIADISGKFPFFV